MRFLVFAWDEYYPEGGACDFRSAHKTKRAARTAASRLRRDWVQVAEVTEDGLRIVDTWKGES